MNYSVDFELLHNVLGKAYIMNIALDKLHVIRHSCLMASRKIIINYRREAALLQLLHHVRADIARTAGYKNIHRLFTSP